jgi:two-component system response regulator YesN
MIKDGKQVLNVLVADDDILEGKVIRLLLEKERPMVKEVYYARSGNAALEIAKAIRPQIAFIDVQMPGMDGVELTEKLKQLDPEIEITMISAYDDSDYILNAMKTGASYYLLKPARPQEILRIFDKLLKSLPSIAGLRNRDCIKELTEKILLRDQDAASQMMDNIWQQLLAYAQGDIEILRSRSQELAITIIHFITDRHHSPDVLVLFRNNLIRGMNTAQSQADIKAQLTEMVYNSIRLLDQYANDAGHELISRAHEFIQKNLHKNISLEDVAQHIHLSIFYFSRLFKDKTGVNYIDYLIELRLEKSKMLLLTTNDTVASIAKRVGYAETNSFSRLFKSRVGLSPSQYRSSKGQTAR